MYMYLHLVTIVAVICQLFEHFSRDIIFYDGAILGHICIDTVNLYTAIASFNMIGIQVQDVLIVIEVIMLISS
jgi:hypothetical protein